MTKKSSVRYSHDPIAEAILGVVVIGSDTPDLESLKKRAVEAFPSYDKVRPLPKGSMESGKNDSQELRVSDTLGYALGRNNTSIHVRPDEFSFHRERPYDSWETFYPEAIASWKTYRKVVGISKIKNLFVRYVNRIDIPLDDKDRLVPGDYFTTFPNSLQIKGAAIAHYFNQYIAFYEKGGIHAIVTHVSMKREKSVVPFILEIDVHIHKEISPDANLGRHFARFRDIKDELFNQLITPKCKKLLK